MAVNIAALNEAADVLLVSLAARNFPVFESSSWRGAFDVQAPPNVVTEAQRKAADGVFTELRSKIRLPDALGLLGEFLSVCYGSVSKAKAGKQCYDRQITRDSRLFRGCGAPVRAAPGVPRRRRVRPARLGDPGHD